MTRPLPLFFPGGAPTGVGLRRRPAGGGGGASSKALVAPSDFTYLGAFRVPASVDYGGSLGVLTTAYTYGGLALRRVGGEVRLFGRTRGAYYVYGELVYEMTPPASLGTTQPYPYATVVRAWGDITGGQQLFLGSLYPYGGSCRAGSTTTGVVLAADSPSGLAGYSLQLLSGPAADGTPRLISSYDGTGKVATLASALPAAPAAGDSYGVYPLQNDGPIYNYGLHWDEQDARLYWSYGMWYGNTWPYNPGLGFSTLDDDTGTATGYGPWRFDDFYEKAARTGVLGVPQSFADAHLGGKRLAVGFGGYHNQTSVASLGPALTAIDPPPATANAWDFSAADEGIPYLPNTPLLGNSNLPGAPLGRRNPDYRNRTFGYARGATSTTIQINEFAFAPAHFPTYEGQTITILSSSAGAEGQSRLVTDHSGDPDQICTLDSPWDVIPAAGDSYETSSQGYSDVPDPDGAGAWDGYWGWNDMIYQGAIWLDGPGKHGLLYYPVLGHGHTWYERSDRCGESYRHWRFCYDPADLAAVASGSAALGSALPAWADEGDYPDQPNPLGPAPPAYFRGEWSPIGGVAFDDVTSTLYLLLLNGYSDGPEGKHVVYCYHVDLT